MTDLCVGWLPSDRFLIFVLDGCQVTDFEIATDLCVGWLPSDRFLICVLDGCQLSGRFL